MTLLAEFSSIRSLSSALRARRLSAVELATDALRQARACPDPQLFLHIDEALTLEQARAADRKIAEAPDAPLAGIPIAHKDLFVTQGWRTTAASRMLADYQSPFDAAVVQQLKEAGTVSLGKLSCDEFAMGSANEKAATGPVRNPWNPERVPGGSSGGSAAAVAGRFVLGASGTDTGGSIRQPAALCGVSGIKPTYGTVSRHGIIAYASSLDQAGVIAHDAGDLLLLLDTISGFDARDATSLPACNGQANQPGRIRKAFETFLDQGTADNRRPLAGLRIGVPREYFEGELAAPVADAIAAALQVFENLGATRVSISLPHTNLSIPAYYVIAAAEASSNLSRYDGVRYGHRAAHYTDAFDMTCRSRTEGFGDEVKRRILVGTYVLSHGYYDAYYLQAQKVRRLVADDFERAFSHECDVIMGPVTPDVARRIGEHADDPIADWLGDIYTLGASLAGLPALSIPCGFNASTPPLPIGLQLIGPYFDEGRLLAIADCYQRETDWHQHTPGHS